MFKIAHLSILDSLPLYTDVFTTDMGRAPMDMSECSDNPKWNYNTDFPNPTVGKKIGWHRKPKTNWQLYIQYGHGYVSEYRRNYSRCNGSFHWQVFIQDNTLSVWSRLINSTK